MVVTHLIEPAFHQGPSALAPRLTVVVSQSSSRDSQSANLEETLVAELMMTPNLDATMIGPLESVHPDDTDYLCLDSLNHNFAILSWLPTEEVARQWQRLSLSGQIVHLGDDQSASMPAARRIFHLRLTPGLKAATALDSLQRMAEDRKVRTVNILLPGQSLTSPQAQASEARASKPNESQPAAQAIEPSSQSPSKLPSPPLSPPGSPTRATPSPPQWQEDGEEEDWAHLDQLVDDFDSLDF